MKAFHEVRNYKSGFKVWHGSFCNISFIAHWHKEIELIFVRSGTVEIHVNSRSFMAQAGDLVVCDSGEIHYGNRRSDNSCLDFVLFDPALIGNRYHYNYFSMPFISAENLQAYGLSGRWTQLLAVLDGELDRHEPYYQDIVKSEVQGFWFSLLRHLPVAVPKSVMQNRNAAVLVNFQELLAYMEEHCSEPITLEDAAARMGFSPSHFSKLFHQLTGVCFVSYLNIIRTSQAADLLITTNHKLTDIALSSGFSNIRTFNRVFRKNTGYTPTEYVKQPESKTDYFNCYRSRTDIETQDENNPTIRR